MRSEIAFHLSSIEPKKLLGGFGGCFGQFFQRKTTRGGDCFGNDARVRRFASFSAKRNRREIWAIRFHHKLPERNLCRYFANRRSILESNDAGKRHEMVQVNHFVRLFKCAAKAMKNTA